MILKRLYTSPQLFKPVDFVPGINYIFGKKSKSTDTKESLNGIGKSTFLDLIDFCLLANISKRLNAAYKKDILKDVTAVLEFEVGDRQYEIRRSFDRKSKLHFAKAGTPLVEYDIGDLKEELCNIIFYKGNYPGHYSDKWFRRLMPFHLKVQDPKKNRFVDPVNYLHPSSTPVELNCYHLFFMNLDNTLAYKNLLVQDELKSIKKVIKEVKIFLRDQLNIEDIGKANNKSRQLSIDIENFQKAVDAFKLNQKYRVDEEKANRLTADIKTLWFQNHLDRKKINAYNDSLKDDIDFSTRKIQNIYRDLNAVLARNIKKTLDDAIDFRKKLSQSRREFIASEIKELETLIREREEELRQKEEERAVIFEFLKSKDAIKDLTEALHTLDEKRKELSELDSRIKFHQNLEKQLNQKEIEEKAIEGYFMEFTQSISQQVLSLTRLFRKIHNALYPELMEEPIFGIDTNKAKPSKLEINVLTNTEMFSKGRNQGRTLIYDLMVLFNAIDNRLNAPRFLVHDGIFDGMDKAHFIALYQFLDEKKQQGNKFQYIMTYNEEGTLTDNFGDADLVTVEKIEKEAILVLTPQNKLLDEF